MPRSLRHAATGYAERGENPGERGPKRPNNSGRLLFNGQPQKQDPGTQASQPTERPFIASLRLAGRSLVSSTRPIRNR